MAKKTKTPKAKEETATDAPKRTRNMGELRVAYIPDSEPVNLTEEADSPTLALESYVLTDCGPFPSARDAEKWILESGQPGESYRILRVYPKTYTPREVVTRELC
jgi:hypothetical protein